MTDAATAKTEPATAERTTVLLVGPEAAGLAPRLEVSGYRPLVGEPVGEEPAMTAVAAVILSPGREERIPELRRRLGARPFLLGIGTDSVEGRSHCLDCGADDFWLPSLGTSDLLTRLRLHLGTGRPRPATAVPASALLQVADLRVDPVARQAWRGQRQLGLTAREFQLLLLLLRHRGTVVSRERILEEIWSDQGSGASNVIEVYVRYLRQKLEQGGERRLIHTLRGRGYCLSEGRPPAGSLP
ncbi:MAG: transcriptional regulator [Cyanobium sp. CACIAM 14]|nr:MAG: transcriptional regulator [Cyanobium sp. CACIAM 14]